jgi:HEAT repeat protein
MGGETATGDAVRRAAELAALGLASRLPAGGLARLVAAARDDADPRVRAAALGALVRRGNRTKATAAWRAALDDPAPAVRRRAAELSVKLAARAGAGPAAMVDGLVPRLGDPDVTVVEAAAWALGELGPAATAATAQLASVATGHADALAREAAVAALGSIGDGRGLAAVLAACTDKPAVRRRAVLALAPFDGPEVDAAIARALTDRDWQVRQAAEDLSTATR